MHGLAFFLSIAVGYCSQLLRREDSPLQLVPAELRQEDDHADDVSDKDLSSEDDSDEETLANATIKCGAQEAWRLAALSTLGTPPGQANVSSLLNVACKVVENVCLRDHYLVSVGPNRSEDLYFQPPVPKDAGAFKWFHDQDYVHNENGYYDGGGQWVQRGINPIEVRLVANGNEEADLKRADRLDVVPILFWSVWPENPVESFENSLFNWLMIGSSLPAVQHHPLVLAYPNQFALPRFWKILETVVPAIETSGSLGQDCGKEPLCFKQLAGCRLDSYVTPGNVPLQSFLSEMKGTNSDVIRSRWSALLAKSVQKFCGVQPSSYVFPANKLVVAFGARVAHNRRVLNLQYLLSNCATARVAGRQIECRQIEFKDLTTDMCQLQDVDILVTIHGATEINGMFMRPGTSMIELKGAGQINDPRKIDVNNFMWTNARKMWFSNSSFYWFYGLEGNRTVSPNTTWFDGTTIHHGGLGARDLDVKPSWSVLQCLFNEIIKVGGDPHAYEAHGLYGQPADCHDTDMLTVKSSK